MYIYREREWGETYRDRDRECVSMFVCVRERERESETERERVRQRESEVSIPGYLRIGNVKQRAVPLPFFYCLFIL